MLINKSYVLRLCPMFNDSVWDVLEFEYCISAYNPYEDITVMIPYVFDEFNVIDVYCSGQHLIEVGSVSMLESILKDLLIQIN